MLLKTISLAIAATCLLEPSAGLAAMSIHANKLSIYGQQGFVTAKELLKIQRKNSSSLNATCAEVVELRGSLVCAFKSTLVMNESLLRIGFYTGTAKGVPKGTVVSNDDRTLKQFKEEIAGHTVTVEDSFSFFRAARNSNDRQMQPTPYESDFFMSIVQHPKLANAHAKFSIIALPVESADVATVVRHEINHAKYYLDANYNKAVGDFWVRVVSPADKGIIARALSAVYNVYNEDIIIDEFQAYLMEGNIPENPLRRMIKKYKTALISHIKQYGSEPITY